ncbi:MAG: hypothetical protein IOC42_11580, partial [Methylobacterium sp.]|nr:hypothetical protein [Methylobacterium sp.]
MVRFLSFRCLLLALGALVAGLQSASALSYRLADAELPGCNGTCPKVVVATGTIGQAEHVQLAAFLERAVGRGAVSQVLVID